MVLILTVSLVTACNQDKSKDSSGDSTSAQAPVLPLITKISAETNSSMTLAQATQYCQTLNAPCENDLTGTACGTSEGEWNVPTAEQLSLFVGSNTSQKNIWTRTVHSPVQGTYVYMNIFDGLWGYDYSYSPYIYVRCVK